MSEKGSPIAPGENGQPDLDDDADHGNDDSPAVNERHDSIRQSRPEGATTCERVCPITENGFVRILSNPNYPGLSGSVTAAAQLLQTLRKHKGHTFWPGDYSIVDESIDFNRATGNRQLTDLYLLSLAAKRKGKFSSLDTRIPAHLVQDGTDAHEII